MEEEKEFSEMSVDELKKLYAEYSSQPSRAVWSFKATQIKEELAKRGIQI